MRKQREIELYRLMFTAREIDERERVFISQNLAHFHVSGAGHEATAALVAHLTEHDWLHLHYRDKALLLARGLPIAEFFRSLLGRGGSHSAGRQMSAHFSAPNLKITSLVGPVGNNALQAVGVAAAIKDQPERPIVVCSVGDGTTQEGEFLEAIAEAVRWQLPVLFLIQDNRWSISTPTRGKTFFDLPSGPATEFYGMTIHRLDGADVMSVDTQFSPIVAGIRDSRRPQLLVLEVERLANHTNADDQSQYRKLEDIGLGRAKRDPLVKLRNHLLKCGITPSALDEIDSTVRHSVNAAAEDALLEADPAPAFTAKAPQPTELQNRSEYRGNDSTPRLTMREAICVALHSRLTTDPRVFLYGQDIEDPKGDVFGVTRGLSTAFPGRVVNAPLSESTIVGTSIGRALTGQRPVAFIQFADFLPIAFNQIVSELGSMYWRTNGGWQCPVILMATCGGYKPGLGPFHAQTMDGFAAHVLGVDVVMPSSASDAAGLLNAAFESPRPTIFFYPKSCLNLSERTTSNDVCKQFVSPGKARRLASGTDLTLVTWGNPVAQCEQAVAALSDAGFSVDFFDLRSVSPWDEAAVIASAEKTGRLVVVHEDNHTGGFGAEVLATVGERVDCPLQMRRITRPDTYIPYHYGNQLDVLPSLKKILETCADLVGCDVNWEKLPSDLPGQCTVRAIGSGPADETVDVIAIHVQVGEEIKPGQVVAEIEATKSVVEICATVGGIVSEIVGLVGKRVPVGSPILRIVLAGSHLKPPVELLKENSGLARITARKNAVSITNEPHSNPSATSRRSMQSKAQVFLSRPATALGSRIVHSKELADNIPGWTVEEVVKRTGVESRHWVGDNETVVSLAVSAANTLLGRLGSDLPPISLIACSTTTPKEATPSISCQVATKLAGRLNLHEGFHAFDFNAACSGFLYGLRLAWDHLQSNPEGAVLLLTAEGISMGLNLNDPTTCFLFGDAATATLVSYSTSSFCPLAMNRPDCYFAPDDTLAIWGPCSGASGHMVMDGIAVARTAYKAMGIALNKAIAKQIGDAKELAVLLPHPGSKRILQNVAELLGIEMDRVWNTLSDTGNTSGSSIPIAIDRFWDELPPNKPIGMTAFGAGFTSAATVGVKMV